MENSPKNVRTPKKLENGRSSNKMFENYWKEDDIKQGLENGSLFEGYLRINTKNYRESYIAAPDGLEEDILIEGLQNRNRALNGDLVVCVLLPAVNNGDQKEKSIKDFSAKKDKSLPNTENESLNETASSKSIRKSHEESMKENLTDSFPAEVTPPVIVQVQPAAKSKNKKKKNLQNSTKKNEGGLVATPTFIASIDQKTELVKSDLEFDRSKNIDDLTTNKEKESHVIEGIRNLNVNENDSATKGGEISSDAKMKKSRRSKRKAKNAPALSADQLDVDPLNKVAQQNEAEGKYIPKKDNISDTVKNAHSGANADIDHTSSRKTAKVVFIKEQKHSRRAIGQLRPWPYGQSTPTPMWILFTPKDHRIPRFKIPYTPDLDTLMTQPNMLYLAKIDAWEDINHPLGSLCLCVGNSGDIEAETLALLLEHEVDYAPFPESVINDDLPSLPWSVPSEELKRRRDYRNDCIFTIDPSDAKDLDDAVCGRLLKTTKDGTRLFQISVHIADVSFFVKEKTLLDQIASERATSTYLVDRVIPMLPSVLCEHVCSLNPGEDRLAFSVEWIIDDKGQILEEWFGRSVIRSCVKLSYDHAQAVIEGRDDIDWPEIKSPFTTKEICDSIKILQELAGHLRKKRVDQGALRIDLPRLAFSMDWSTRTPVGFRLYELKESNRLIEEFMLLANMRVAEKIYKSFPSIAVLRCHPEPLKIKLQQLSNTLQTIGIFLDVTSSSTLQESLLRYSPTSNDAVSSGISLVISNLLAKPMKCASYICSGLVKNEQHFRHYALSVPFYTHFTSPIRRYPDILVHRLLNAALQEANMEHWESHMVKKMLENCNSRKLAAKTLQEKHGELHLANLIRKHGSIEVKGIVIAVLNHSVDVVFLYLGIQRRIYLDKLPLEQMVHENFNGIGKLNLIWKPETASSMSVHQTISVFSMLEILLVPHTENDKLDFSLILQRPSHVN